MASFLGKFLVGDLSSCSVLRETVGRSSVEYEALDTAGAFLPRAGRAGTMALYMVQELG